VCADQPKQTALKRAIEKGASLTSSTGGAAVGMIVAGPAGAVAGAAAGWATEELVRAGVEITQRWLSPRAEVRVGAVFRLADDEISVRLMAGEEPREDLRAEITPGRSAAAELVEAALIAAAQTYEERKIPYMAHLLAAVPFERSLGHADANQLLATAEYLTYRQLVILAAFATLEDSGTEWWKLLGEAYKYGEEDATLASIRVDMLDLFQRGLLDVRERSRTHVSDLTIREELPWPAVPREMSPSDARVSTSGERFVRMMRLDLVPVDDRESLVMEHLRARR
jgi:hypothetical protein